MVLRVQKPEVGFFGDKHSHLGNSTNPDSTLLYSIGLLVAINTNGNKAETQRSKTRSMITNLRRHAELEGKHECSYPDMYGVGGVSSNGD